MVNLKKTGLSLKFRPSFAFDNFRAANKMSALCYYKEQEHSGESFGAFFDDISDFVRLSIFSSVASLESYINEIYTDRDKHFEKHDIEILDIVWEEIERKKTTEKYQLALKLRSMPNIDKGSATSEYVESLINLRNELIHFKPEWVHLQQRHDKIGKSLIGKIEMSPFLKTCEPVFPLRCMSYSLTKWAIDSIFNYINEFSRISKIEFKNKSLFEKALFIPNK